MTLNIINVVLSKDKTQIELVTLNTISYVFPLKKKETKKKKQTRTCCNFCKTWGYWALGFRSEPRAAGPIFSALHSSGLPTETLASATEHNQKP